jgi:hypothetical protein
MEGYSEKKLKKFKFSLVSYAVYGIIKTQQTRKELKMTRLEMLTYCINDQIKRGLVSKESFKAQIKHRSYMRKPEVEKWYNEIKAAQ